MRRGAPNSSVDARSARPQQGGAPPIQTADEGYTLLEISIVLFVLSLFGGGVMRGMGWAMYAHDRWEERVHLENTVHLIGRQLADDVQHAESLSTSDTLWIATHQHGVQHAYRWHSGQLWRNEQQLLPEGLHVSHMTLELEGDRAAMQAALRGGDLGRHAPLSLATVYLRVVGRYDSLQVRTSIAMRPSLRWGR